MNMMAGITFSTEPNLHVSEFVDVLRRSTLAERRPVNDVATMAGMLAHAGIIVTARNQDGLLVGVSRAFPTSTTARTCLTWPSMWPFSAVASVVN
jgi:predicted GNAT superfamily acetyltransferase